jgi:two-component system chemotaxis response regulator CheB
MDIHMPGMDGITATREIMKQNPVPIVVASATLRKRDVDLAMKAYQAGAVSVIEKPEGAVLLHLQEIGPTLRQELIAASKAKLSRPSAIAAERVTRTHVAATPRPASVKAIGICASTGGPPLLLELFSALPRPFPLPLLLVQHISHGFEDGFARWLSDSSGQMVKIASSGQRLEAGVWLAPGGRHLMLASATRMDLPPGKASDIHCPSGNPLFESLAQHLGPNAAGVVLTGMGDDGATGLLSLKQAGGVTIVQDEPSSLIWGMPKAAQERGAAGYVLNPHDIVRVLEQMAKS